MLRKTLHSTSPQEQTFTPPSHRSYIVPLNDGDTSGSSSSFSAGNGPITSTPVSYRPFRRSPLNESAGSMGAGEGSSSGGMLSSISTIRPALSARRALRSPPPGSDNMSAGTPAESAQTRRFASSLSRRTREKSGSGLGSFAQDVSLMDERSLSIATIQHVGDRQEGEEDYGFDSRELPDSREGSLNDLPVSAFMQRWAILVMSVR